MIYKVLESDLDGNLNFSEYFYLLYLQFNINNIIVSFLICLYILLQKSKV
ncbi:unnamed protein product [Paramecium sonneborni]|uniref:Uncharacterized protein n=1 Tax=Paramecium sonneborni TaxID=65129 RepID=A0A8S1KRU3_9CILI|nr:unnamed protein product [Paramecium sonneborni]